MNQQTVLHNIQKTAQESPDKICVFEKNRRLTYKQFWNAISLCACRLEKSGIRKGERVAIMAEQSIHFLELVSAVHLVGAVIIPLEKNLPKKRIVEILDNLETSWLISKDKLEETGINVLDVCSLVVDENEDATFKKEWDMPNPEDLADILFTTGTTGDPKGIQVTHLANKAIAENVIDSVDLQEDDIELVPTPINHSLGLRRYYGAMYRGSTIGLMDGVIYTEDFFDILERYKVTAVTLVPTMLSILLKLSKDRLQEYAQQIRFIQLGSAPIPNRDKEKICELLPNSRLYNTYGATEAGCTCILDFNHVRDKRFCIGRLTTNTKLSFVNDNGEQIETSKDKLGYLVFEGLMVMKGYWKDPKLTNQVLKNGKIYTNDVGYLGEDGFVYLLGRKGDVINSGGNKIAPLEIEEIMSKYETIEECACIPVHDNVAGQLPKLFVVMKPGEQFCEHEILSYLARRLEPFKVPKYVEVIDKLPRAYNGKLLRKELIEREE